MSGTRRSMTVGRGRKAAEWLAPVATPAPARVLGIAGALLLFMLPVRAHIIGFVPGNFRHWPAYLELAAGFAYDGALVVAVATLATLVALAGGRRWGSPVTVLFGLFAVLALGAGIANVQVIAVLGRPLSFQWLYYSQFLGSIDARQAVAASVAPRLLVGMAAGAMAMLCTGVAAGRLIAWAWSRLGRKGRTATAAALLIVIASWLWAGHAFVERHHWPTAKVVNPVHVLVLSALNASDLPPLFTMPTSVGVAEFERSAHPTPPSTAQAPVRNVVLFVFESLAARYVGSFGAGYGATPHLDRWARRGVIFENAYAHSPATNKALFSILTSLYPWVSFRSETAEQTATYLPTLSEELRARGFRTGVFYSGDLVYQNAGDFMRSHGFEHLEDYRERGGEIFASEWGFLKGTDDRDTVRSMEAWRSRHAGQRWLAVIWTNMTHYPYFIRGAVDAFPGVTDESFARYLTALRAGDAAFGQLMVALERSGDLDDTLVVALGDHGEAFLQHGQLAHASHIYEENVHVPLVLINPQRLSPGRHAEVVGLVDLAPTVLRLAGVTSPAGWQGRDLFSADRPRRTFYFAPFSDLLFGCREDQMSYIFNASDGSHELFDLSVDPGQLRDLSGTHALEVRVLHERVAAWVQYQHRLYEGLFTRPPDPPGNRPGS